MARRNNGPRLLWLSKRGCWYIVWTERGRSRQRSTGTSDREQAQATLGEFLRKHARRAGPRNPSEVLVTDLLVDYVRAKESKIAAPWRIACAVEVLTPFFEGKTAADITPETCDAYAVSRSRAPGTIRRELGVLRAAVNLGFRAGAINRPILVELPAPPESKDRWLTRKEAAALLRAARTRQARLYMPLFILLGIYTGRRKEAILSLRWPQVDLEAGTIDFDPPGRKRTNKRRGFIPIPPRLMPHLVRARRRGSDLGYVLHIHGARILDIKKGFEGACDRAKLKDVTPHTLRHTAATWIARDGQTSLTDAAEYLAMSEATLRKVYRHHHPEFLRGVAATIGRRARGMSA
jgi:integrase